MQMLPLTQQVRTLALILSGLFATLACLLVVDYILETAVLMDDAIKARGTNVLCQHTVGKVYVADSLGTLSYDSDSDSNSDSDSDYDSDSVQAVFASGKRLITRQAVAQQQTTQALLLIVPKIVVQIMPSVFLVA